MYKILSTLFFVFIIPNQLLSQVLPKEGSKLNYRLIGFSFPVVQKATKYTIELANGNYSTEDSFQKNIIQSVNSKNNKIIAEVPSFGRQYTWRTVNVVNATVTKSELHHFSTSFSVEVDTNSIRLRITSGAVKHKDAYVFLDGNRALYDMEGHAVWYLPDADRFNPPQNNSQPAVPGNITVYIEQMLTPTEDLKLTPQGTITFIYNYQAYEVNYDGDVLWKGPKVSSNIPEPFHREFTRLSNGHYMALGSAFEEVHWKSKDSVLVLASADEISGDKSKIINKSTEFGTVTEYDQAGNIIWSWNSSKYFIDQNKGVDLYYCEKNNGQLDQTVHDNSFFFDEKDSAIYVGFRNVSRIIKVQYPSGKILAAYGNYNKFTDSEAVNSLFCSQHCCRRSQRGYLYLFNNNLCNYGVMPKIEVLQEPLSSNEHLKKIWEYSCTIEPNEKQEKEIVSFRSGGSVMELPDQSMFTCMGRDCGKVFIVSHEKQILWSAVSEKWNRIERKWENIHLYRASIVLNRKEMESLIWGNEKK